MENNDKDLKKKLLVLKLTALAIVIIPMIIFIVAFILVARAKAEVAADKKYGVFLGVNDLSKLEKMQKYETIVIDADNFTKAEIEKIKGKGNKVYSYISIGSLEDYRDFYEDYKDLAIAEYEGWEGEYWVKLYDSSWRKLIRKRCREFIKKGIDGFFVDNPDVYELYREKKIYNGITKILKDMKKTGREVMINGGSRYIKEYMKNGGNPLDVIDGVSQENVFTTADVNGFGLSTKYDEKEFKKYLKNIYKNGVEVLIIEYVRNDDSLKNKINAYCSKTGWACYVSETLNLE